MFSKCRVTCSSAMLLHSLPTSLVLFYSLRMASLSSCETWSQTSSLKSQDFCVASHCVATLTLHILLSLLLSYYNETVGVFSAGPIQSPSRQGHACRMTFSPACTAPAGALETLVGYSQLEELLFCMPPTPMLSSLIPRLLVPLSAISGPPHTATLPIGFCFSSSDETEVMPSSLPVGCLNPTLVTSSLQS